MSKNVLMDLFEFDEAGQAQMKPESQLVSPARKIMIERPPTPDCALVANLMHPSEIKDFDDVIFPVIAMPQTGGIRVFHRDELALTASNGAQVANPHMRKILCDILPNVIDGEVLLRDKHPTMSLVELYRTPKAIECDFVFWAYDLVTDDKNAPYAQRLERLEAWVERNQEATDDRVFVFPHKECHSPGDLASYQIDCLASGYDGIQLRDPQGPYVCRRSTLNEGYWLKPKKFGNATAKIIGFEKRGPARKTSQTLGSLLVWDEKHEFHVSMGFNEQERRQIWKSQDEFMGAWISCKFLADTNTGAPALAAFSGWRPDLDE